MRRTFSLLLLAACISLGSLAKAQAEDEPDNNDLGHGSCAAFEEAVALYEKCLQDNKLREGTRSAIYQCGKRPVVPARCG